jgi:hypothetical protein
LAISLSVSNKSQPNVKASENGSSENGSSKNGLRPLQYEVSALVAGEHGNGMRLPTMHRREHKAGKLQVSAAA